MARPLADHMIRPTTQQSRSPSGVLGLLFPLDLQPSLQVRLEGARELYEECVANRDSRDFNLQFNLCRLADLVMYGDDKDACPMAVKLTAFRLWEFLQTSEI